MVAISNIIVTIIGLIILWIIASIPVYIAAKALTGGRASFGAAMGATLGGVFVYGLVLIVVGFFLTALAVPGAGIWALILAFLAWLAVYRSAFHTGWLGALGIAIVAVIVFFVLNAILGALFGISFPDMFPFPL
jgi:hypothetical protein